MAHQRLKSFSARNIVDGVRSLPSKMNQIWQERPADVLIGAGFTLAFGPVSGLTYIGLVTVGDAAAEERRDSAMGLNGEKASLFSAKGIKQVFSRMGEGAKRLITEGPSGRMMLGAAAVATATALTGSVVPAAFVGAYWGINKVANRVIEKRNRTRGYGFNPRP